MIKTEILRHERASGLSRELESLLNDIQNRRHGAVKNINYSMAMTCNETGRIVKDYSVLVVYET